MDLRELLKNEKIAVGLPLFIVVAITFSIQFLYFYQANWGRELLSSYQNSDAFLFHYKAWYLAFINDDGGFLNGIVLDMPYLWLLSFLFKVFGPDYKIIFITNILLSCFITFFSYLTTYKLFSIRAAIFSGLIVAFYGPLVFFSGLSHKICFSLLLISSASYFSVSYFKDKNLFHLFLSVFIFGVACLSRNNAAVIILILSLMVFYPLYKSKEYKILRNTFFTFFLSLLLVFIVTPNKQESIEPNYTSPIGMNFYLGNGPGSDGGYREFKNGIRNNLIGHAIDGKKFVENKTGTTMSRWEISQYWISESFNYFKDKPIQFVALQFKKAGLILSNTTYGDPEEYRIWRWEKSALILAFIDYGLLISLFIVGLCFLGSRIREPAVLFVIGSGFVYILSVMLFHVNERYRLPYMTMLVPIAGYAVATTLSLNLKDKFKCAAMVFVLYMATIGFSTLNEYGPGWSLDAEKKRLREIKQSNGLAEEYAARENSINFNRSDDWLYLAKKYSKRGFHPDAEIFSKRTIASNKNNIEAYKILYQLYFKSNDAAGMTWLKNELSILELKSNLDKARVSKIIKSIETFQDKS